MSDRKMLDLTLDEAKVLCRACRPSGQILPFNDLERDALAQVAARLDRLITLTGSEVEPELSEEAEEVWYEVTDWAAMEADVKLNVPHVTVRGPIEDLMVVVVEREILQEMGFERFASYARRLRETALEALRQAGWMGNVVLVTSDVKLVRFKKVEV